jgi:hypothetical protein
MLGISAPIISAAPAAYYEGKTIRVIIPFSPGGGTDTFGRLIARFLGEHVPGRPTVIAENVTGAGGLLGANEFAGRVAHDGTTLLTASGQLNLRAFLGLHGLRLKLNELQPVVAAPMGHVTVISSRAGVSDATQLPSTRRRLTKGLTDPIGTLESLLALDLLGVTYRPVPGYSGRAETRIGLERGELMINTQSTPAYLARVRPLVDEGRAIPLYAIGFIDDEGRSIRDPALPDLITAPELYEHIHGRPPAGMIWEAYQAVIPIVQNTRGTLWAHADIPAAARDDLQLGIAAMVRDPAFLAASVNILQGYEVIHGEDLKQIRTALRAPSPEVIAFLREMLTSRFGLRFQ